MSKEQKQKALNDLRAKMLRDETLPLKKGATNLVFGEGDPEAQMFFLGEGPGYWEDIKARPFVGNAGALLNQLLYSIKVPREEVFITNVVCYRPPGNRDPEPSEIEAFQKYIDEMIKIIEPKIIVTLGRFSMGKFLPGARISSVHGKTFRVNWKGSEIVVVPMYHPAAALRSGEVMAQIKADFLKLPEVLKEAGNLEAESSSEQMILV
jgi:uracil-DNA glycosylase family 4